MKTEDQLTFLLDLATRKPRMSAGKLIEKLNQAVVTEQIRTEMQKSPLTLHDALDKMRPIAARAGLTIDPEVHRTGIGQGWLRAWEDKEDEKQVDRLYGKLVWDRGAMEKRADELGIRFYFRPSDERLAEAIEKQERVRRVLSQPETTGSGDRPPPPRR